MSHFPPESLNLGKRGGAFETIRKILLAVPFEIMVREETESAVCYLWGVV
jgi:hypothetical protein